MRARRLAVAAVASHTCLPPSVSVIVAELAEFRVEATACAKNGVSTVSGGVCVFVAVGAMSPVFSEGSGAGGGREGRAVGLKRGTNVENLCKMILTASSWTFIKPRVGGSLITIEIGLRVDSVCHQGDWNGTRPWPRP